MEEKWNDLYLSSKMRTRTLEATKDLFSAMTVAEIKEFLKLIDTFVKEFTETGPPSVGDDLDAGLKMMDVRTLKQIEQILRYFFFNKKS